MKLYLKNFLSIKEAELSFSESINVIVSPNAAGKTQIMMLIYSILWTFWKVSADSKGERTDRGFRQIFSEKLKNVFLVKELKDLINWEEEDCIVEFRSEYGCLNLHLTKSGKKEINPSGIAFKKSPIYLNPSGLGDYYKGIYSLKKYYPNWKIVSEAVTDLLNDIFIVSVDESIQPADTSILNLFEDFFGSKFFIQEQRIYVSEKGKKYVIEKTASGYKSLAWIYLVLKHKLLGNTLLLDEPEANLHPVFIKRLVEFIYYLSKEKETKIIVATHSDYLLQSLNIFISKHDLKVDVNEGKISGNGAFYSSYKSHKDHLVDTSPLSDIYLDILREGFGIERD